MSTARGTFDVTVEPITPNEEVEGLTFSHMSLDKRWEGDFEGTSTGEMLTAGTMVDGKMSAGYVASERMHGSLAGRRGRFVLQHTATMDRGSQSLTITVVPDSGTGELKGLSGSLAIEIVDEQHHYNFDYTLP